MKPPTWMLPRIHANQRKASAVTCRCGDPIVTGLDDDQCAMSAAADPYFLTWGGELAAVLEGRRTYTVLGKALLRRDHYSRLRPSPFPVLAEHRCGHALPAAWRTPLAPPISQEVSDVPPF